MAIPYDRMFDPRDPLGLEGKAEYPVLVAEKLFGGEVPVNIPWGDPRFQQALIRGIERLRQHEEDARKLAIVKEVFRGAK